MKNPTTADLATKWNCTPRTIRNWRQAGAPLQDDAAMKAWLSGRKNLPPNLSPPAETGTKAEKAATVETPEASGAGAALGRLERAELAGYRRLQTALDANDALAIRVARDSWLAITDQLRHYERAVSEAKREAGALVNRSDVVHGLKRLGHAMQLASIGVLPMLAMELAGESDIVRSRIIIRKALYNVAIASYGYIEAQGIARWMVDALTENLISTVTVSREEISAVAESLREQMELATANVIASEPRVSA